MAMKGGRVTKAGRRASDEFVFEADLEEPFRCEEVAQSSSHASNARLLRRSSD